jgi:central kinetochore subunit Mis15/CHL4
VRRFLTLGSKGIINKDVCVKRKVDVAICAQATIMAPLRGPTTASIPGHIKVPSTNPALIKTLSRLSRSSLIFLALTWLETDTNPALHPYLESNRNLDEEAEEDYLYTPAKNIEELRTIYQDLAKEKGTKREIAHRILDGDWRRGISLQQLAMIDFRHLQDNDTALRWTALKLVPLHDPENSTEHSDNSSKPRKRRKLNQDPPLYPEIQPATMISTLSSEISTLVKAHYYHQDITLTPATTLPVLRLHLSSSPYTHPTPATTTLFLESARTLYISLPPSCPYVYVALSGPTSTKDTASTTTKTDIATLKHTVLSAVPKALSRPHERWSLEPTDLTARSLRAICALRGNERRGASGGAFSIFAEGEVDTSPLDPRIDGDEDVKEIKIQTVKRKRKILAERDTNVDAAKVVEKVARRFGGVGIAEDPPKGGTGRDSTQSTSTQKPSTSSAPALDRVSIRIESDKPDATEFNITFSGSDVFAGLRALAELGGVHVEGMPAWMTGEEGASAVTVRDGVVVEGRAGGA